MVSQRWRSAAEVDRPLWEHELIITVPKFDSCGFAGSLSSALLLIDGGSNPAPGQFTDNADSTLEVAAQTLCMVIARLKQVPNQPLNFSDESNNPRSEDEILAYSFDGHHPRHRRLHESGAGARQARR
jgi:PhoPQ-activated pathogenicity-related protein